MFTFDHLFEAVARKLRLWKPVIMQSKFIYKNTRIGVWERSVDYLFFEAKLQVILTRILYRINLDTQVRNIKLLHINCGWRIGSNSFFQIISFQLPNNPTEDGIKFLILSFLSNPDPNANGSLKWILPETITRAR